MTLQTVKDRANDWLTPRWQNLVDKQDFYRRPQQWSTPVDGNGEPTGEPAVLLQDGAGVGRYFQGLWTHTGEVEQTDALDGDQTADNLAAKPTDQAHDWRDLIQTTLDAVPFPARLKIDVYDGPAGHGWFATLEVRYQGNLYRRSKGIGPEDRDAEWHLVTEVSV